MNRWDLYRRMVVDLDPILADMTAHGVRLDLDRQRTLIHQLEDRIDALTTEATALAPLEVRPRKLYKRRPTETDFSEHELLEDIQIPGKVKVCSLCGARGITKGTHMKRECRKGEVLIEDAPVPAWNRILPFNPLSGDQLKAYAKHFRHPLGKDPKTGRPTLDDGQLEKLQHKYGDRFPMYGLVRDLREVAKMRSTYAWEPDARGYITGQYVHAPKTGRLAQRNYNLMNVPHREGNPWAEPIRRTLRPSPGCVFVEADSSAIEAVLTGYFAGDSRLIDLSKRSVHAYLCCQKLGLAFTPEHVTLVKTHHEGLYSAMKQTVYLSLYGGKPRMMLLQAPKHFRTLREAEEMQAFFLAQFPSLTTWWDQTREFAHKHNSLTNPWGWKNYFYNVYRRDDQGHTILGEDKNEVAAFLPQSAAAMFMRDNLRLIGATWARPYMPAIGTVHDSVCLDVPEARVDEAIDLLVSVLSRPIPELGGLRIGCEVKVGDDWWAMSKVRVEKAA